MKTRPPLHLDHILVARDLAGNSDEAVRYALALARRCGATVHVVHGAFPHGNPDDVPPEAEVPDDVLLERMRADLESRPSAAATFDVEGVSVRLAVTRDVAPAGAILQYAAEHHVDLIVTGTHGRRGLARLLNGSVSEQIARSAPCPVSIVGPAAHGNTPPQPPDPGSSLLLREERNAPRHPWPDLKQL